MAFPLLRGASSGVTARPPSPAGPSCSPAAALHFRVLLKECDAVVFVGRHSPASLLQENDITKFSAIITRKNYRMFK